MLQFSKQHKIVNDVSISFQKSEKVHTRITDKMLVMDRQFYNPIKYESFTEQNFKFLVLWTVFKNNTNKISTLKLLNSFTKDDFNMVQKEKEKIILYTNTIETDFKIMKTKVQNPENVLKLYKSGELSILYFYWYFSNNNIELSRIQERQVKRVTFFMKYFPKIKEFVDTLTV